MHAHTVMVLIFPLNVLCCRIIGCLVSAAGVLDQPVQSSRSGGEQCEALEGNMQQKREVEERFSEERVGDGAETSPLCYPATTCTPPKPSSKEPYSPQSCPSDNDVTAAPHLPPATAPFPTAQSPGSSSNSLVSSYDTEECRLNDTPKVSAALRGTKETIRTQIEALKTPCYALFTCTVSVSSQVDSGPSKKKRKSKETSETKNVCSSTCSGPISVTFEWIEGDSKDLLHQIMQYLRNTMVTHQINT